MKGRRNGRRKRVGRGVYVYMLDTCIQVCIGVGRMGKGDWGLVSQTGAGSSVGDCKRIYISCIG
jgi:hypothetical protein